MAVSDISGRHRARDAFAYLRRIGPLWLLVLPFWTALPFLTKPTRLQLLFSGSVPPLRIAAYLLVSLVLSFAMAAYLDWDRRRKRRKRSKAKG